MAHKHQFGATYLLTDVKIIAEHGRLTMEVRALESSYNERVITSVISRLLKKPLVPAD